MSMNGFCETDTYTIHCDGSCAAAGYDHCDGFACPTGECIHETVSWSYCGSEGGGDGDSGFGNGLGSPSVAGPSGINGGGSDYSGIFIPLPYSGDEDLNNPDFILACQTSTFITALPSTLKNIVKSNNNSFIYPMIVDFFRQNGGITLENKNTIIFALTNLNPVLNLSLPNWAFTDITLLNYNAFNYLLQNPNTEGHNTIAQIVSNINYVFSPNIEFAKFSTSYFLLNPNTTIEQFQNMFMGTTDGIDGNFDQAFWDNPNLSFPIQNMPSWNNFNAAYPKNANGTFEMEAQDVYNLVGGRPKQLRDGVLNDANPNNDNDYDNACALRVSRALNYSGIDIPNIPNRTFKGEDNKYYFLGAANLFNWMIKTFPLDQTGSYTSYQVDGENAGPYSSYLTQLLDNDNDHSNNSNHGLYIMLPNDPSRQTGFGASGHAGIYNTPALTHYYFNATGGIKLATLWILN
jgi:hypothetical protein